MNQRDDDGSLEFVGEDIINHTAEKEKVLVKLGNAFDVVGERKQTDFKYDSTRQIIEEEYEIKLRNHKKSDVNVIAEENLGRGTNWEIIDTTGKWTKENSQKIQFRVAVDADDEEVITYRVRYSW